MKFSYFIKSIGLTSLLVGLSLTTAQAATVAIHNCTELQNINEDIKKNFKFDYVLANDIDCSATNPLNENYASSICGKAPLAGSEVKGFQPINNFVGSFDGQNHTISNLYISSTWAFGWFGLFEVLSQSAKVKNLNMKNAFVNASGAMGLLTGRASEGSVISNVHVQGSIVSYVSTPNTPFSSSTVGGLVGVSQANIYQSSADINIVGKDGGEFGGLVGFFETGVISQCKTSGSIAAGYYVGGIIGVDGSNGLPLPPDYKIMAKINDSYSTINIILNAKDSRGYASAGGVVGYLPRYTSDSFITNTYFAGTINSTLSRYFYQGGVLGVSGSSTKGYITNSYFNSDILNQTPLAATYKPESKKSAADLTKKATFTKWNFNGIWEIKEGVETPRLSWENAVPVKGAPGGDYDRRKIIK